MPCLWLTTKLMFLGSNCSARTQHFISRGFNKRPPIDQGPVVWKSINANPGLKVNLCCNRPLNNRAQVNKMFCGTQIWTSVRVNDSYYTCTCTFVVDTVLILVLHLKATVGWKKNILFLIMCTFYEVFVALCHLQDLNENPA